MRPSSHHLSRQLIAIILSLLTCVVPLTSTTAQTETTGAIEGQVFDSQKQTPVAGIVVQLINQETEVAYPVRTDAEGRFVKQQLLPGTYTISVRAQGYQPYMQPQAVYITKRRTIRPLPIPLVPEPTAIADTMPDPTASPGVSPTPTSTSATIETGAEDINTIDGRRDGNYPEKEVKTLPLGASTLTRTFDELALLLPGVAPPPQTLGDVAGPGVGPGIGSAGQFAVNGLRSRGNNFTVDGSDNNDEDIGVRRQGFLALVPQPIESIQEYRVTTLLAPAQYGRNFGAQVNAVSKSGTSSTHGTLYGFLNTSQLNARNFFDTTGGNSVAALRANGQDVLLQTQNISGNIIDVRSLTVRNGSGEEDSLTLAQAGGVLSGPLVPPDPTNERSNALFYFISAEGQLLNATKEANFVVPTIAQRSIFNSGVTGVFVDPFFPVGDARRNVRGFTQGRRGAGVFSLFPFPNNPTGIYDENTLTRTLPASGFGKILSGKTNGNFYINEKRQDITARYNFTDDARTVPVTGGALFSSVRPRVRTQNFSTFLNSEITGRISNEVRASYGRTRLIFDEVPDREFLIPSQVPFTNPRDAQFLLNAPYIVNITRPSVAGVPNSGPVTFVRRPGDPLRTTSENATGPVGQVRVAGFSPLGVDVFNFPQRRVNNTYQLADTLNVSSGDHNFAFGADIRRVELNSDLPRISRPLLVYGGQVGSDQRIGVTVGGTDVVLTPQDLVAAGAPTGFLQTFGFTGDAAINLRYYEYNFFGQDEWRIRPNLSLSYGLRYEYNSPPDELNRRIESTFSSPLVNSLLPALRPYLDGRTKIYDPERKNFAPRVGIAYAQRLFGSGRETVFRAGYGIYYDQILGAVVSQSRNVFPNFLTANFGGGTAQFGGPDCLDQFGSGDCLDLFSPAIVGLPRFDERGNFLRFDPFVQPGTLNRLNRTIPLQEFFNTISTFLPAGGFGVTLPTRRLKTPMAQHYSFTVEQPLGRSMVVSAAYVGTMGRHLLRVNTPNAGENLGIVVTDFFVGDDDIRFPQLFGFVVPPTVPSPTLVNRPSGPNSALGAVNLIETSANSRYDALQVQVRGRYTQGLLYQAAYTFSEATDDVSDVFDLAGAPALPQNFSTLAGERGPANFDVRHRFSYNLVYSLPALANHSRAVRAIFGGLEIASTGQFQTGQPFTVNSIFDVNGDGNFTDRLDSTSGLVRTGDRQRPLQLTGDAAANPVILLADDFEDGQIGRNTFRASNLLLFNLAFIKNFAITEQQRLTFRTEIFNLTNRANFSIPVRFLEAPGFGEATDTVTPGRRIQFALKYSF